MKLQEIIDFEINVFLFEQQVKFNLSQFKELEDIEEKINYAEETLQELGRGSSRVAFLVSKKFALKIVNPNNFDAGIEQNKTEVLLSKNKKINSILTKIYDYDKNYSWIIVELVTPVKNEQEFEKLSGVPLDTFNYIISDIENFNYNKEKLILSWLEDLKDYTPSMKTYYDALKKGIELLKINNNFINTVISLIKETSLITEDVGSIEHWGKTTDGRIVLLDYGITKDVWTKHY